MVVVAAGCSGDTGGVATSSLTSTTATATKTASERDMSRPAVVAVQYGPIDTAAPRAILDFRPGALEKRRVHWPMGRFGSLEEPAATVAFLRLGQQRLASRLPRQRQPAEPTPAPSGASVLWMTTPCVMSITTTAATQPARADRRRESYSSLGSSVSQSSAYGGMSGRGDERSPLPDGVDAVEQASILLAR